MDEVLNWCREQGVQVENGLVHLYKAVKRDLSSIYFPQHKYQLGIAKQSNRGIHLSTLEGAAIYRIDPRDHVIECLVPVDEIRLSQYSQEDVMAGMAVPVRIVPEAEYREFLIMR